MNNTCINQFRYGSVCSGIEAATVAWHSLNWQPAWFSEIEKFPSAVLAHHYPVVPNFGDITKFEAWPDESIDLLVGGTPCQSFSVAGLRRGLADPRGNLMLTFLAIAQRQRPKWIVWENVPGVLSSNRGRDFGTFLGALGELGYGWAYRVLDAQWFGVAQRRRRVFVIGYFGDWRHPAKVLFESESVCRDTPPSREKGQGVAGGAKRCTSNDGVPDVAQTLSSRDYKGPSCGRDGLVGNPIAVQGTLIGRSEHAGPNGPGFDTSGSMFTLTKTDVHAVAQPLMQVRRLTPVECERLQGFPDDYTNIPWREKPESPDGPRYKALGNSMAVPVMRWIGKRIKQMDELGL